jgi:RsiW-degrading membrane proteinase PrsW (M82 family)
MNTQSGLKKAGIIVGFYVLITLLLFIVLLWVGKNEYLELPYRTVVETFMYALLISLGAIGPLFYGLFRRKKSGH